MTIFFNFDEGVFPRGAFIDKSGVRVQHTNLRTPDDDVILKSEAPVSDAPIPSVVPSTRHIGGDKIVDIKALPGPDGELMLSFLHASGKHRLQPVRSLDVLIRQLAAQPATPTARPQKTNTFT